MLSQELQEALNDQINAEFHSGYLYLAMVAYFEDKNLDGCAHWMRIQAQEEIMHGMKIFDYMIERGVRVVLQPVKGPPKNWTSPLKAFEAAHKHEITMTKRITDLANLAQAKKDHPTNNLIQWFIDEQVEEESQVEDIVKKIKMVGDSGTGLFMIDRELMNRPAATLDAGGQGA